jgi:CheY-like chemotaxis protein
VAVTDLEGPPREAVVLLAEDERLVRDVIGRVLRGLGLTVLEAADGPGAERAVAGHAGPIDLLLADVRLPGTDGRELARRLAERRAGLRVLYLSGWPEGALGGDSLPEGADFLAKPFRIEDLEEKVRRLLGR